MKHFFIRLGKTIVGYIAVLSTIFLLLLLIGFFMSATPTVYVEDIWQMFAVVGVVAISSSIFAWRWRKEIWFEVLENLLPF